MMPAAPRRMRWRGAHSTRVNSLHQPGDHAPQQANVQRVKANVLTWSAEREDNALLEGLVICGTCGESMLVR